MFERHLKNQLDGVLLVCMNEYALHYCIGSQYMVNVVAKYK